MPILFWANHWLPLFRNYLFVLRGAWLLVLFNIIALIAFVCMPQGTDTLLLVLENMVNLKGAIAFFCLLCALFCWCISLEFCTRLLIYMTDNAGYTLSTAQVNLRKNCQKRIAQIFLFYPIALVAAGFSKAYLQNDQAFELSFFSWILVEILLGLLAFFIFILYTPKRNKWIKKNAKWLLLSRAEKYHVNKLHGIFNNAQIPVSIFKNLIRQIVIGFFIACSLIVCLSFSSIQVYQTMGATSLICCSFACWQLIYTCCIVVDKIQPIKSFQIPYSFFLLCWICFCSYVNQDHPVQVFPEKIIANKENNATYFKHWIATHTNDSSKKIPVFFIAAEGGGLRTAAFTAMVLAKLQDSFPNFNRHIYAYSTVSGGSLGAHFFNSLQNISSNNPQFYTKSVQSFFTNDFLAATTGKLVFSEILNYFIPFSVARFDRSIALENAWEEAWQSATNTSNKTNVFKLPFSNHCQSNQPALFINTVEAETGLPCIYSNLLLDTSFPLGPNRDIAARTSYSISYSSAINLSCRFPLLSPAGMMYVKQADGTTTRKHYIDGGYYENTGQETVLQILESIDFTKYPQVQPYIIHFNFLNEAALKPTEIHWANELSEIFNGVYHVRNARDLLAAAALKKYMDTHFSSQQIIECALNISPHQIPMNWVLSKTAINRMDQYTNELLQENISHKEMQKIFSAFSLLK
ncbi:MAG: hypothetical protein WCL56_10885 [Sediminibacterium sp.]